MAQSCAPRSRTVTPGISASRARSPAASAVLRSAMASMPHAERVVDGDAQADLGGGVALPHLEAAGVARASRSGRAPPSWRRGGRASPARSRGISSGCIQRNPVPRGPRRNFRPLPVRIPQPSSCTSSGSWPADWQASSTNSTPASRQRRPTSTAGFTSPLWVGTWTSDTMAVSSSASARSSASRSIWPCSSSSMSTSWHPVRRCSWSSEMALAPYSARPISTRSWARSAASTPPCPRPGWPSRAGRSRRAPAPISSASASYGALQRRGGLGGGLVAAGARLALEVADHRVEHRLGEQRGAGVVEVQHLLAPGREGPRPVDVDGHPPRRLGI